MDWAKFISEKELQGISNDIKDIEKHSAAEVVAVIANKSSTTRHIKFTLFLILTAVTFVCLYGFNIIEYFDAYYVFIPLIHLINIVIAILLSRLLIFQRLFIPRCDRKFQVENLAELEFYKQRINMTRSKTGLLIYISLMEKQAVVLCDKSIAEKFPKDTWQNIVDIIINGIHNKSLAKGLSDGVKECSARLKENFPIEAGDINELPNHVVLRTHT